MNYLDIECGNENQNIKKKEETHKMADANKAFAHFRYQYFINIDKI